jgi:hypothetical protein
MYMFHESLRRVLGLEKFPFFSDNHVNDLHKKVDGIVRWILVGGLLIWWFIDAAVSPMRDSGWIAVHYLLFVVIGSLEMLRAFIEWWYGEERKRWILTAGNLAFGVLILAVLFTTDFLGLFR